MKRWLAAACLAVLPLAAFAQSGPRPDFPRLDWKAGTSVTASYQELTGTVVLGERVVPVLKVRDVEYVLMTGPHDPAALSLKNGATATFKGVATKIVQAGQADKYVFRPFEATVDGQTLKFERAGFFHNKHPRGGPEAMTPKPN